MKYKKMMHPARHELFAYAECLADQRPVPAGIAAHAASCPACREEVRAIRRSLEFAASAPALEPSTDLTAQILLAAKQERAANAGAARRAAALVWMAARGTGYAAALLLVIGLTFAAALGDPTPLPAEQVAAAPVAAPAPSGPSPEAIRQAAAEVRTLSAAVRGNGAAAQSDLDRARLRAVNAMDGDIAAAKSALERNPACVRATHIVHATLQQQAETLRDLYTERSL